MNRSDVILLIKGLLDAGRDWADLDTRAENLLCHLEQADIVGFNHLKESVNHKPIDRSKLIRVDMGENASRDYKKDLFGGRIEPKKPDDDDDSGNFPCGAV